MCSCVWSALGRHTSHRARKQRAFLKTNQPLFFSLLPSSSLTFAACGGRERGGGRKRREEEDAIAVRLRRVEAIIFLALWGCKFFAWMDNIYCSLCDGICRDIQRQRRDRETEERVFVSFFSILFSVIRFRL